MPDDTICQLVTLDVTSDEYSQVKKIFTSTMPTHQQQSTNNEFQWHQIVKIERIQNPVLYTRYVATKKSTSEKNSSGFRNERTLFYGCPQEVTDKINHCGFNQTTAGNNGLF